MRIGLPCHTVTQGTCMLKRTVLLTALSAAFGPSYAADNSELAKLREEIRQLRQDYESRIQSLEQRLQVGQAPATAAAPVPPAEAIVPAQPSAAPVVAAGGAPGFNP